MKPETRWTIVAAETNKSKLVVLWQAEDPPAAYCATCGTTPCLLPPEPA